MTQSQVIANIAAEYDIPEDTLSTIVSQFHVPPRAIGSLAEDIAYARNLYFMPEPAPTKSRVKLLRDTRKIAKQFLRQLSSQKGDLVASGTEVPDGNDVRHHLVAYAATAATLNALNSALAEAQPILNRACAKPQKRGPKGNRARLRAVGYLLDIWAHLPKAGTAKGPTRARSVKMFRGSEPTSAAKSIKACMFYDPTDQARNLGTTEEIDFFHNQDAAVHFALISEWPEPSEIP